MTDSNISTAERLEHALDQAVAGLEQFQRDYPDADLNAPCGAVDEVVTLIVKGVPLRTLGGVRLQAKALQAHYGFNLDAALFDLLEALEHLPQRLWGEPIGQG